MATTAVGINLFNTGKRYNREWIFRRCTFQFQPQKKYAITGANGSGKSTLLQVIAGAILQNEGKVEYYSASTPELNFKQIAGNHKLIDKENQYKYISIATPYLELIEEMTAEEMMNFHGTFKPFIYSLTIPSMLQIVGLENAINKQIRFFSSGMKQRLKLALAFFSDTPILLLDEPTTNLDADGIAIYQTLIDQYTASKMLIISSNTQHEFDFCEEIINTADYK